jgi:hypothetical protein
MGEFPITYPVTDQVRQSLSEFRELASRVKLPKTGRSPYQVVRVLGNTHCPGIRELAEFIDAYIPVAGAIGKRLLQQRHQFQFDQSLAELFLFAHLCERLGESVEAVDLANGPSPDIRVCFSDVTVAIEVYSPTDLIGFQLFQECTRQVLKYLEIPVGFKVSVTVRPVSSSDSGLYYPYTFPSQVQDVELWLDRFAEEAGDWLKAQPTSGPTMTATGPGGGVEVEVQLIELRDDEAHREVIFSLETQSTDTSLLFDMGTAEERAQTRWGRNLREKLEKKQCGPERERLVRILVVNFGCANVGWPKFIAEERFGVGFEELIRCLVGSTRPYDVVLPAMLTQNCCFGKPVWINGAIADTASQFMNAGALD